MRVLNFGRPTESGEKFTFPWRLCRARHNRDQTRYRSEATRNGRSSRLACRATVAFPAMPRREVSDGVTMSRGRCFRAESSMRVRSRGSRRRRSKSRSRMRSGVAFLSRRDRSQTPTPSPMTAPAPAPETPNARSPTVETPPPTWRICAASSSASDLIDPTIAVHHGRIVKRTGDGALVEFRSVVEAVRCAITVQNAMTERNVGMPPDQRIEFRIGIHLGDVVEESDGDLMGDGVNIAARLEGIAQPGAICLSEDAYRQVKGRIDLAVIDLGPIRLKNIAEPVRAYSLQVGVPAPARPAAQA